MLPVIAIAPAISQTARGYRRHARSRHSSCMSCTVLSLIALQQLTATVCAAGPPAQRLLLSDAASFVARILFVMGVAASPHEPRFGDEPALSAAFAARMDSLAECREALRKLPGPSVPTADVDTLLDRHALPAVLGP